MCEKTEGRWLGLLRLANEVKVELMILQTSEDRLEDDDNDHDDGDLDSTSSGHVSRGPAQDTRNNSPLTERSLGTAPVDADRGSGGEDASSEDSGPPADSFDSVHHREKWAREGRERKWGFAEGVELAPCSTKRNRRRTPKMLQYNMLS